MILRCVCHLKHRPQYTGTASSKTPVREGLKEKAPFSANEAVFCDFNVF